MSTPIKKFRPIKTVKGTIWTARELLGWAKRGFQGACPQYVKQRILSGLSIPDAQWVETGTYYGTTTEFLSGRSPFVHTIEPDKTLYEQARAKFEGANICAHYGTSEVILPELLASLNGDVNFWLDGHYSGGVTFRGEIDCPVESELSSIAMHLGNFSNVAIFIDDIRFFNEMNQEYSGYPSLDDLVAWANQHQFQWRIFHDIFLLTRKVNSEIRR